MPHWARSARCSRRSARSASVSAAMRSARRAARRRPSTSNWRRLAGSGECGGVAGRGDVGLRGVGRGVCVAGAALPRYCRGLLAVWCVCAHRFPKRAPGGIHPRNPDPLVSGNLEGVSQHGEGDPAAPRRVAADLVFIESAGRAFPRPPSVSGCRRRPRRQSPSRPGARRPGTVRPSCGPARAWWRRRFLAQPGRPAASRGPRSTSAVRTTPGPPPHVLARLRRRGRRRPGSSRSGRRCRCVLALDPDGAGALLHVASLVHDQFRGLVMEVFDDILAHVVPHVIGVPSGSAQQVLHAMRWPHRPTPRSSSSSSAADQTEGPSPTARPAAGNRTTSPTGQSVTASTRSARPAKRCLSWRTAEHRTKRRQWASYAHRSA